MLPRLSACMAPFEPHKTSSSAGGSLTIVRRKSEAAATSCGDFASFAPAATSSSAREPVRFHTVREYPALMRFMPMGRPIKPSPTNPIFLVPAEGSKGGLLEIGGRNGRLQVTQKEETIVAESQSRSREANISNGSGGFGSTGEREDARGAAGGSSRSGGDGSPVRRGAGIGFFLDAHQVLVRDFPAEMLVLSALLEILFKEDGTAGIGHESARGRQ